MCRVLAGLKIPIQPATIFLPISIILLLAVMIVVPAVIIWNANRTPIPQAKVRSEKIKVVTAIFLVFLFDLGLAMWLGGQVLSCLQP